MKHNKQLLIISTIALVAVAIFAAHPASAAFVTCGGYDANGNPQNACQIGDLVQTVLNIINFLLAWAWLVSMFFMLWAANTLIGSGGNAEEITKGKATFKNAIIGFFLIMAAYLLINFIVAALSGSDINSTGGYLDKVFNILGPKK